MIGWARRPCAATVRKAVEETSAIDFREVIEHRPVIRSLLAASSALLVATLLVMMAPGTVRIAMKRLFLPLGNTAWPQRTHFLLDLDQTTLKVARGDSFTLSVKVRPGDKIPESAQAKYEFADGDLAGEPLRPVEGGEFRGRIESVNQPFRFTVKGGDDSSSIVDIPVKVVPPPTLKSLVVRLTSPAYTGIPSQVLAPGLTQLRALEGTKLELLGVANKPLARAVLNVGEAPFGGDLKFDQARTGFRAELTVKNNFNFWFDLVDTEGFRNRDAVRYEVRGFADLAPRVVIDEPKSDRDVPPEATIPVRVMLDDDFGLQAGKMIYRLAIGDSEPREAVTIPLWAAPTSGPGPALDSLVKHQEITHNWQLAPLKLPVGAVITFHAEALDFDTIKGPNLGKSREIRLRIISKEDAARQFDDSRRDLREEVARVLTMQKHAITPVDNAIRSLRDTPTLPQPQRDDLNNAGMIQRQVGSRLNNRDEGVGARLRRSLEDLENFKLDNPEARKQMEGMLARLSVIRDQHLGPAEQGISRATKSLDQGDPKSPAQPQENANDADGARPDQSAASKSGDNAKNADGSATPKKGSESSSQGDAKAAGKSAESAKSASGSDTPKKGGDSSPKGDAKAAAKSAESGKSGDEKAAQSKGSEAAGDQSKNGKAESKQAADQSNGQSPSGDQKQPGPESAKGELAQAKTNQKAIADELQKMLDSLSEFETYRGLVKDAQELLKQQEQAMKQTAEAADRAEMTGKPLEALSPEQKAELANLASRQSQIGKGLQNLHERMGEMAQRTDQADPLAAAAMRDAAQKSQKQGTAGKMAEAADKLEKNQMGQARPQQEQAREELRDLVDAIQNRRERELARLVKELKNAENELAKTRERQAQNLKKTREAQRNANAQERKDQLKRLAKEQADIRKDLDRQLQRLAKLSADRAARAGENARGRMERAQGNMDQDDGEEAGKEEEEALAQLEDAQDELEQARREAEEQLAVEQLARMGDRLKSLAERQEKVVSETGSYETLRQKAQGRLTVAQRAGVKGLGQVQAGLKEETADLTENLDGAPVFALTLRRASESMQKAADELLELKTGKSTEAAARAASDRFKQLLESLRADNAGGQAGRGGGGGGDGGGGGGGGGGGNGDGIPATAQLKMLKSLQKEINDRTETFDEMLRRNKTLSPEQNREVQRLGEEQGVLADLVRDLTRPKRDDGEE